MSMDEWTPEGVKDYSKAIKAAERQEQKKAQRKEKWLNDFIDGQDMRGRPFGG